MYHQTILLIIILQAALAKSNQMLIVNTWPFTNAAQTAGDYLRETPQGDAIEAVVRGCSVCEAQQCDFTVGYGGSPDEIGETTLDAMVMDGDTIDVGAVGNLRFIKSAIRVAQAVLEHTNHTLLAGESATDFATEFLKLRRTNLTTERSEGIWKNWKQNNCQPNYWNNVIPDSRKNCGPYSMKDRDESQKMFATSSKIPRDSSWSREEDKLPNHDTIGMIAIDSIGKIVVGTTTNGLSHKIHGRVGDSPIMGAGAYADSGIGAAVGTGDGDVMMRFLPTFLIVELMRNGASPQEACDEAIERIKLKYPNFSGALIGVNTDLDVGASKWRTNFVYSQYNFTSGTTYTVKV